MRDNLWEEVQKLSTLLQLVRVSHYAIPQGTPRPKIISTPRGDCTFSKLGVSRTVSAQLMGDDEEDGQLSEFWRYLAPKMKDDLLDHIAGMVELTLFSCLDSEKRISEIPGIKELYSPSVVMFATPHGEISLHSGSPGNYFVSRHYSSPLQQQIPHIIGYWRQWPVYVQRVFDRDVIVDTETLQLINPHITVSAKKDPDGDLLVSMNFSGYISASPVGFVLDILH